MIAPTKSGRADQLGLRCPSCGCGHVPVYYTRQKRDKTVRVRICRACGRRFMTTERVT